LTDRISAADARLLGSICIEVFNPVCHPAMALEAARLALSALDHRKFIVVDGKVGFCGGMNISEDYGRAQAWQSAVSMIGHTNASGSVRSRIFAVVCRIILAAVTQERLPLSQALRAGGADVSPKSSILKRIAGPPAPIQRALAVARSAAA
jgi:hypothetical protein